MTHEDTERFEAKFREYAGREAALHNAKRNDYTGGKDPLFNYHTVAQLMNDLCGPIKSYEARHTMFARLLEKIVRLGVLTMTDTERRVADETIDDTVLDISILAKLIGIEVGQIAPAEHLWIDPRRPSGIPPSERPEVFPKG
jgi:hypothetical protein